MSYDPKKSRPDNSQSKSIIDQIIEEPAPTNQTSSPYENKKIEKEPVEESADILRLPTNQENSEKSDETPLIMQPQVWVAAGIAALLLVLVVKKRKKR